jgi:hypothetical protein
MNPLRAVHVADKASDVQLRGDQVWVLVQCNFFFLDRADDSLGIAVLFGVPNSGHTDLDLAPFEGRHVVGSRILQALIRVMDFWPALCQRTMQSLQPQFNAQAGADCPAADDPGEDIHQDRQVNERPVAEADVGDVNGLLTNDKFCLIRTEKLQLRKTRSFHHSPVTTI